MWSITQPPSHQLLELVKRFSKTSLETTKDLLVIKNVFLEISSKRFLSYSVLIQRLLFITVYYDLSSGIICSLSTYIRTWVWRKVNCSSVQWFPVKNAFLRSGVTQEKTSNLITYGVLFEHRNTIFCTRWKFICWEENKIINMIQTYHQSHNYEWSILSCTLQSKSS